MRIVNQQIAHISSCVMKDLGQGPEVSLQVLQDLVYRWTHGH